MSTYQTCSDCGSKMYGGFCSWCDEEVFIEEQYEEQGLPIPESLAKLASQQRENPSQPYQPRHVEAEE